MKYILICECERCGEHHTASTNTDSMGDYIIKAAAALVGFARVENDLVCPACRKEYELLLEEQAKAREAFKAGA